MTVADVLEYVKVVSERQRLESKRQAVMLFNTAGVMSKLLSSKSGSQLSVWEAYPYWTDEEVAEIRIQKYKNYFKARSSTQNTDEGR